MVDEQQTLASISTRVSEGHDADCAVYPDFGGVCVCGYEKAIVDLMDMAAQVEEQARVVAEECQGGGPWSLRINHLLTLIIGTDK